MNLKEAFNNDSNIERVFKVIRNQEGCSVLPLDDVWVSDVDGNKYIFRICDRPVNTVLPSLGCLFTAKLESDGVHWQIADYTRCNQVIVNKVVDNRTVSTNKGIFKCAIFSDDIDSLSTGRFSWASKRW
ncbi:hypothetical protein FDB75_16305 [Clostridium botulinum]|nr:hypothetical protein [Clostridium botulinum]NFO50294.1 hypothetical protein [Clostridium botulinum]